MYHLKKNQLITHPGTGIVYRIYGKNTRSRTYHIEAILVPKDYTGDIKEGEKFNLGFKSAEKYGIVTGPKEQFMVNPNQLAKGAVTSDPRAQELSMEEYLIQESATRVEFAENLVDYLKKQLDEAEGNAAKAFEDHKRLIEKFKNK